MESLCYKDSTKATRYAINFNCHTHRTSWNDQALTCQYYKGLPDRLKDEIARVGKPADLHSLQDLVATLDQRYWERQSEKPALRCFDPDATSNFPLFTCMSIVAGRSQAFFFAIQAWQLV